MNNKNMLILCGYSKYNIDLLRNMKEAYSKDYNVTTVEYDHWYNDKEMDYDNQLNKIGEAIKDKDIDIIVAKSIGTYLSTKAMKKGLLNPKVVVFLGYPLAFMEQRNLSYMDDLLSMVDEHKVLFIQQEKDPLCSAQQLKEILKDRIPLITVPGDDHSYGAVEDIKVHVDEFIQKNLGKTLKK